MARGATAVRPPSIERTEEYDKFIEELHEYHEKRGTTFEPEPKVGPVHIDLLRLYKRVLEEGGYDVVSDVKSKKLAWRKLAGEFLPLKVNVAQLAFMMKTSYYKNLAAYEISTFHKREPPPKEILEDVTAAGGDLLTRTLENFQPKSREVEQLADGNESDEAEEQKTPDKDGADKMDIDDAATTGRSGRSLRQAPPQRIPFGSEPTPSGRQARSATNQAGSPTPGSAPTTNGTYNANSAAISIVNYEPRPQVPATVKPVVTPANNADHFRQVARKMLLARRGAKGIQMPRGMMAPGTGFAGPSIYNRTLLAVQSNVPEEVRYALHHLVKISHERGDKYRFDQFVGLAEALIEKVMDVSRLFYGFKWQVSYNNETSLDTTTLNGLYGTRNLLQKIKSHRSLNVRDGLQSENFARILENVNEAGLVIRNMVMLDENAVYLCRMPLIKDLITIVLNLPQRAMLVELRHYTLEIAEQLTKYYVLPFDDPLYVSLLAQLDSNDRGVIVTALRAISRISMNLEERNRLPNVSTHVLRRITDWLLVEDEELRNACLDFLYQFTADPDNVRILLRSVKIESVIDQLSKDLMHGARRTENRERSQSSTNNQRGADVPPKLSKSIVEQLCMVGDEREQSSQWLQTCFERDDQGEITQLALWSAYNEAFANLEIKRPLMQAKDFIQNVSVTFPTAQAQVVPNPDDPKKPRYTIRGIRPRAVPVDSRGRPFLRCLWRTPVMMSTETANGAAPRDLRNYEECDMSVARPEEIWDHVLSVHLNVQKDPATGRPMTFRPNVDPSNDPDAMDVDVNLLRPTSSSAMDSTYNCHWAGCKHFDEPQMDATLVIRHVATHLPDTSPMAAKRWSHNRTVDNLSTLQFPTAAKTRLFFNTIVDERNDAAGLPLASILVLRNLARQMRKIDDSGASAIERSNDAAATPQPIGGTDGYTDGHTTTGGVAVSEALAERRPVGWVEKCFLPIRDRIFYTMAYNLSLQAYLAPLLGLIDGSLETTG